MEPLIDLADASAPPAGLHAAPPSRELQQLWFSLAAQRWSSLLVVPAPGVRSALPLGRGLVQVARRANPSGRVFLLDATRASLEQLAGFSRQLAACAEQRERILAVVDPVDLDPAALALAPRCDAAMLCVALGRSALAGARMTLEQCGRSRFIGSVVLLPDGSAAAGRERSCAMGEG